MRILKHLVAFWHSIDRSGFCAIIGLVCFCLAFLRLRGLRSFHVSHGLWVFLWGYSLHRVISCVVEWRMIFVNVVEVYGLSVLVIWISSHVLDLRLDLELFLLSLEAKLLACRESGPGV